MFSGTLSSFSQSGKFSPRRLWPFGKFSFCHGKRNSGAEWKLLLSEIKVNSNQVFLTLWEASNYISRLFNHNMRASALAPAGCHGNTRLVRLSSGTCSDLHFCPPAASHLPCVPSQRRLVDAFLNCVVYEAPRPPSVTSNRSTRSHAPC